MAKKMTTRQAWIWLAKQVEAGAEDGCELWRFGPWNDICLCGAILEMRGDGLISEKTFIAMKSALNAFAKRNGRDPRRIYWHSDRHGAKLRAAFCRREAEKGKR